MLRTGRLTGTIRGHKKSVVFAAAALVLASAGTASAATVTTSSPRSQAGASISAHPHRVGRARASRHGAKVVTWGGISGKLNRETNPAAARRGELLPADKLLPAAISAAQSRMPISPVQYANATAIVRQALHRRMGLRSAVIAVATAMQESRLINVNYGTSDSLGLFQQRPSCGWGSAAQIMDPAYASNAFLNALHDYQGGDPTWARQPLYQAAQRVQGSAFPYAYAQWEAQAAHLVRSIAMHVG